MTCWRFPDHIRCPSQVWLSRGFLDEEWFPRQVNPQSVIEMVIWPRLQGAMITDSSTPAMLDVHERLNHFILHTHIYKYIHTHWIPIDMCKSPRYPTHFHPAKLFSLLVSPRLTRLGQGPTGNCSTKSL